MNEALRNAKQQQVMTIFKLIKQFKDSYYN